MDGTLEEILPPFDFVEKFNSFGFDAKLVKGNDVEALYEALSAPAGDRPKAIILDNIKGSGVKDVEDTVANHSMQPEPEVFDRWLDALHEDLDALKEA